MVDTPTTLQPTKPPSPHRRSRGPLIALVVLGVIGLAAIGFLVADLGDDPPPSELSTPSAPPSTGPTTTVDPQVATKSEIVDAYRQSYEAFVAVASDPTGQFDDPRLTDHKKGTALAASQLAIRRLRADGQVLNLDQLEMNPVVVELGPDRAEVEDCGVDVSGIVDQDTGEVIEAAGPPEPKLVTATFELFEGVWMQTSLTDTESPCVPSGS